MPLTIGTQLGSYEVTALLGKGGFGEVYRARDSKLKREVAIKILPDEFSRDRDRVSRFQREAEVLASLNHPNIAAIYDLQQVQDTRFLVLELVEGDTLADRIRRGPMPLDETIEISKQICEGMAVAHEKGVIHRDLKPANIKITPEGKVKVLDFGLARIFEAPQTADLSNSPTLASIGSGNVILGTASYMSPEQARGKTVDRSADVWALACVIYEMLSGRQAFGGETVTDILSAVVRGDPDWTALPPTTPHHIQRLLRRCLHKDARRRLRDVSAVWLELEETVDDPPAEPVAQSMRQKLPWIIAGIVFVAFALSTSALVWRSLSTPSPPSNVIRLSLLPPHRGRFVPSNLPGTFSHDGKRLVFSAADATGAPLWVRALDSEEMKPLPNTADAYDVSWSPDNSQIAFCRQLDLMRMDLASGAMEKIADLPDGRGVSWGSSNVIIFTADLHGPIVRVSPSGGTPTPVTKLDTTRQEIGHWRPQFLPDGKHFLYLAVTAKPENGAIYVGSIDSQVTKKIADLNVAVLYASPGYMMFTRNGNLMAWRFDLGKFAVIGEPEVIARDVVYSSTWAEYGFSVSDNGDLAYLASAHPTERLFWVDRAGRQTGSVGELFDSAGAPRISPDGRRALVRHHEAENRTHGIWISDLARGLTARFTQDTAADEDTPVWSPDGNGVAFLSLLSGTSFYIRPTAGGADERLLQLPSLFYTVEDWSPDGKLLLMSKYDAKTKSDLWTIPVSGDHTPKLLLKTPFDEAQARFSPDGRWMSYVSDESGRSEVYLQSFPALGNKLQISEKGGTAPAWRGDSRELFYTDPEGRLMSVEIRSVSSFEAAAPKPLFTMAGAQGFAPTRDGSRFLVVLTDPSAEPWPMTLVFNWPALLKK